MQNTNIFDMIKDMIIEVDNFQVSFLLNGDLRTISSDEEGEDEEGEENEEENNLRSLK